MTDSLDLGLAGIKTTRSGHIDVDPLSSTSADEVYAVGDVIGALLLPLVWSSTTDAVGDVIGAGGALRLGGLGWAGLHRIAPYLTTPLHGTTHIKTAAPHRSTRLHPAPPHLLS